MSNKFRNILAIAFITATLHETVDARPRDWIQECTNDTFILGIVDCVTAKFQPFLPSGQYNYENDVFNSGRHILGFTEPKDAGIRQDYLAPTISKKLSKTHKRLFEYISHISKALVDKEYEVLAIEKLKQVSFENVFLEYIHSIIEYSSDVSFFTHSSRTAAQLECQQLFQDLPALYPICLSWIETIPNLINCLKEFTQADFEDNLKWVKCFYVCDDLIPISTCMKDHFSQCGKWSVMSDAVIRVFAGYTDLDTKCMINIENTENITLYEGGPSHVVEFYTYVPPTVYCIDFQSLTQPLGMLRALGSLISVILGNSIECNVQIEMSLQNNWHDISTIRSIPDIFNPFRPKCHTGVALRQAVVGYHEHASYMNTCTINITEQNWNDTHLVPLWASIDQKIDGDITTNFTIKLRVANQVKHNVKIPVDILDMDIDQVSLCQSSGDPHIITFDGHYYNNLYDGYFYLYKNTKLPYEVQVIYQRCQPGGNASCTCAVAVKSGDDVFVIDKCRRIGESNEVPEMKAILYQNGNLTAGTRVFIQELGSQFQIILPTGTKVHVTTGNGYLNAYLAPSNYDSNFTSGLCGVFDGDITNDLTMPDGSIYDGVGSDIGEQPREFTQAWRVNQEDRIFYGTLPEDMESYGPFCKCRHMLVTGVECTCGAGELIELCDDNTNDEFINITALMRSSIKTNSSDVEDNIDIDEAFEPPELTWADNTIWNDTFAEEFCTEIFESKETNEILNQCSGVGFKDFYSDQIEHCIQDIQITDTDNWKYIAIESAKRKCLNHIHQQINIKSATVDSLLNSSCVNDCNGRGSCVMGMCECEENYAGGDCSLPSDGEPEISMTNVKCDTRFEDCRFANIFGRNFFERDNLWCNIQKANINLENGQFSTTGQSFQTEIIYISPFQVICPLENVGSYQVSLANADGTIPVLNKLRNDGDSINFLAYDSACYECNVESSTCSVTSTNNHCIINNVCFANLELNPKDTCKYCNSSQRSNEWTWFTTEICEAQYDEYIAAEEQAKKEKTIRISVASVLSVIIIIIAVVLFHNSKKKIDNLDNGELEKQKEVDKNGVPSVAQSPKHNNSHQIQNPQLARIKAEAQQNRQSRDRTSSTSSTQSFKAVGANGPLAFTQYQNYKDLDNESFHEGYVPTSITKGIGAHATPPITRKPFDAGTAVTTWF